MDSLRTRLRRLGANHHQQVDDAFSQLGVETAEGYRQFLQAHAAALFALENTLEKNSVATLLDDWPERRRSDALRADLLALDCPGSMALTLPETVSPAWCWGALYVLEGSRLGGKLLARRLQAAQPGAPMHYLNHAADEGLWPRFLQRLESQAHGW
ncbi:MAG: biliverdin-producing heme oxygenase [Pseudomonas sp.]